MTCERHHDSLFPNDKCCPMILTHAWRGAGAAHNGIAPRGASCRLEWVCETWGRGGGHLRVQRREKRP